MTYYDILGVPFDATQDQIKKAYREQIRFFHPDIFDGSEDVARIKTQQLNEAYEVLKDPEQRRSYDAYLKLNGWYNKYNPKHRQPEQEPDPDQEPDPGQEPEPEKEQESEPERDHEPKQGQEPEQEPEVDPERVAEAMLKQEQESKRFWRNVKIAVGAAALLFILFCMEKNYQRKLNYAVNQAREDGYAEGYENGYEEGNSDGIDLAVDVSAYAFKLEYEGVYTDESMGLYHKAECMLVPETAELVFEEEAIEIGLEPCHFCVEQSNYDLGYSQGYAAGWAARASGEDNYNPIP